MINLDRLRGRFNGAGIRSELRLYHRAMYSLAGLRQRRDELRQQEIELQKKLVAKPDDQKTLMMLAGVQRNRAIARKLYRVCLGQIASLDEGCRGDRRK